MALPSSSVEHFEMLKQRVMTAAVALIVLMLVLFVLPQPAARMVIAVLIVASAWEWSGFLGLAGTSGRLVYVAGMTVLQAVIWWLVPAIISYQLILYVAIGWWLTALLWMFFYPTNIPKAIGWICGVLVLMPAYVALDWLYIQSPSLLLFLLAIVWAADIGAYFAGKKLGRVKLAPAISPGKTWEGVLGGLIAVSLLSLGYGIFVHGNTAVLVPFCIAIGLLSIVGDLTVSMFKRHAGIKDSGRLFPGHGGLLDRIDSVTAASTLFAAGIAVAGLG
jgi:phosphatidate cytidylyltransferase